MRMLVPPVATKCLCEPGSEEMQTTRDHECVFLDVTTYTTYTHDNRAQPMPTSNGERLILRCLKVANCKRCMRHWQLRQPPSS